MQINYLVRRGKGELPHLYCSGLVSFLGKHAPTWGKSTGFSTREVLENPIPAPFLAIFIAFLSF